MRNRHVSGIFMIQNSSAPKRRYMQAWMKIRSNFRRYDVVISSRFSVYLKKSVSVDIIRSAPASSERTVFMLRLVTRRHSDVRQRLGVKELWWRCWWTVSRFSYSWQFLLGLLYWLGWHAASSWLVRRFLKPDRLRLFDDKEDFVETDNFYQWFPEQSNQLTRRILGKHRRSVYLVSWGRIMWARQNSREGRVQCRGSVETQAGANNDKPIRANSSTWYSYKMRCQWVWKEAVLTKMPITSMPLAE